MQMNKIFASVILTIVLGAGIFAFLGTRKPNSPAGEAVFDPLNAAYAIDGFAVVLVNGKAEQEAAPGSTEKIETSVFGEPVRGDLNGDGREDAAVMLVHNPGGSGTFYYAAAALNTLMGTKGTNAVFLGDRIAPQTLELREDAVIANYAERNPGEPMTARPSVGVSKYLVVKEGTLQEIQTKNEFLAVLHPAPYQEITSPVAVYGRSNFFEANTRIRITDGNGKILADTFATAEGSMDKLYPFSKQISYKAPSSRKGTVEVFEESAKDGSEIKKIIVPVLFKEFSGEGSSGEFKGYLVIGHEIREFTPCGSKEALWLAGDSPALTKAKDAYAKATPSAKPYAEVFVVLLGSLVDPPLDGFGADYETAFSVQDVLLVDAGKSCENN